LNGKFHSEFRDQLQQIREEKRRKQMIRNSKYVVRVVAALVAPVVFMAAFAPSMPDAATAAPAAHSHMHTQAQTQTQAQAQAQTWTVLVGAETTPQQKSPDQMPAGDWQLMRFYPDKITVNVGDTIVWKINSAEFHQVVFPAPGQKYVPFATPEGGRNGPPTLVGNPVVFFPQGGSTYDGSAPASSGNMTMAPPGQGSVQEYRLTFTKAGTFNYLCPTHSSQLPDGTVVGMLGSVTVQEAGAAYPKTPAQVDAGTQSAISADQQAALAAEPQAKQVAPPTTRADGTTLFHGNIGWDTTANGTAMSYMRFSPEDFTIHVGDSIEWTQTSAQSPHTVSLTSGAKEPDVMLVTPQQAGPPKIVLNPAVLAPAGGTSYDGTGFVNSGFLPGTQDPTPGSRTYRLTFTKAGTYEFICILHDEMGMNGHVTVLAAGGTTPGMPTTGNGTAIWLLALVGVGASGLALAGIALRRKARRGSIDL
jgi:plastocyanin